MNLDKYKPGQVITSMTRRAFFDLWEDVKSGAAQKRWHEGKEAETKKERTEELRIRTMLMILEDYPNIFDKLLSTDDWQSLELYMSPSKTLGFRTLRSRTKAIEEVKAFRQLVMKRR